MRILKLLLPEENVSQSRAAGTSALVQKGSSINSLLKVDVNVFIYLLRLRVICKLYKRAKECLFFTLGLFFHLSRECMLFDEDVYGIEGHKLSKSYSKNVRRAKE